MSVYESARKERLFDALTRVPRLPYDDARARNGGALIERAPCRKRHKRATTFIRDDARRRSDCFFLIAQRRARTLMLLRERGARARDILITRLPATIMMIQRDYDYYESAIERAAT